MADINIQRKKTAPSPWILVLLAALALAIAAYFFLRTDPADEPATAPPAGMEAAPADTVAPGSPTEDVRATPAAPPAATDDLSNATAESLATQAASDPSAPNYALNGLQKLSGILVALADRDDLRVPTILEQRDNLTSATNRLGEPDASLRPGFVAAAGLIQAMQQKAYPALEGTVNELVGLAGQMSGRSATAADQQQNKQFLTLAADAVRVLSEPAQ